MQSGVAAELGGSAPVRRRTEGPSPTAVTIPGSATPAEAASAQAATTPSPVPAAAPAKLNGHDGGQPSARGGRPADPVQDWRPFLRALAAEIDAVAGTAGRDALLRGVGLQLARMYPVPARDSLDGLAMDMTETLDGFGWGAVQIAFSPREHCLVLKHEGLPRVGGAGEPPGTWLAGTLVGLYEGWMAQQPGTDASLVARRVASSHPGEIVIRYGKE
jgi:hypothetical protein